MLSVYEVHYAADATIRLLGRRDDPHAGATFSRVRFLSEHDGRPVLYGHDLTTEGLRLPYSAAALEELAGQLLDLTRQDRPLQLHVQDQFLRYLLKTTPWPVESAMNQWDVRVAADLIATARAESRANGEPLEQFVTTFTSPDGFAGWVETLRGTYWREHRLWADADFVARLRDTVTAPDAGPHLTQVFARVRRPEEVTGYLADVVLLSLEHALRNLFLVEGSTRDEEVGTHGMLALTYGRRSPDAAVYVYERNQDGNGATRLVRLSLTGRGPTHIVRRWHECALGCPVAEEEVFVKHILRHHAADMLGFRAAYERAAPGDRPSPRPLLERLTAGWLLAAEGDPRVGRLAGILVGDLSFGGDCVASLPLHLELLHLEDELSGRFGRPPLPAELAGVAATRVERTPAGVPALARLYAIYQMHAAGLAGDDEDGPVEPLDRFLTQVEHLSLSTCLDACPACLAGSGTHGPIETTRHLVSRRLLGLAHRLLTATLTRDARGADAAALAELATAQGGLILEHAGPLPGELERGLRRLGVEPVLQAVEYREGAAVVRTYWLAGTVLAE